MSEIWDRVVHTDIFYCFFNVSGNKGPAPGVRDPERELTGVMLEAVAALLNGCIRNAGKEAADHGSQPGREQHRCG